MTTLDLGPDIESGRPCCMRASARFAPGQRVQAMTNRDLHQLVPRGMELDLVDALAETVVRTQARRVGVGLETPIDGLLLPRQVPKLVHQVVRP